MRSSGCVLVCLFDRLLLLLMVCFVVNVNVIGFVINIVVAAVGGGFGGDDDGDGAGGIF